MQKLIKKSELKKVKGDSKYFSGDVEIEFLFQDDEDRPYCGAIVEFAPQARTAWHTHPKGQEMIILEGKGYTGFEDGSILEFNEGDVVLCPKDKKHWHGAGFNEKMKHLVITGVKDKNCVIWHDLVSQEEYEKIKNS